MRTKNVINSNIDGRSRYLTDFEKGQIISLKNENKGVRQIAKSLNRDPGSISRYLNNISSHKIKKKRGRKEILKPREKRRIFRELAKTGASIKKVKNKLDLTHVSISTIWNSVTNSKNFKYQKMKAGPKLEIEHKSNRLKWARKYIHWTHEWQNIIFSDEKKFNLDGPDGFRYYWNDIKKDERVFSKRQMGGGSLMVWLGFSYNGKLELGFVNPRSNHKDYINLLSTNLLAQAQQIGGLNWMFQHDNASIHTAKNTLEWLKTNNISTLDWAPRSPDMNPVENVWSLLVSEVYAGGKQYETVKDLKISLLKAWNEMEMDSLSSLVRSMPNRVTELLIANGGRTNY